MLYFKVVLSKISYFFCSPENNIAVLFERKQLSLVEPRFLCNTRDQILTEVFHVMVIRTYVLQD